MKKTTTRRLVLSFNTVRQLRPDDLAPVAGGLTLVTCRCTANTCTELCTQTCRTC